MQEALSTAVRLSPAAREQLARWVVRALVWLGHRLGMPEWGTLLILAGVLAVAGAVYTFWDEITDRMPW